MTYLTGADHFGLPAEPADTSAAEASATCLTCNPDHEVLIVDRPCGTGKTTTMIETFDPAKRYLVVTPLLSECERIVRDARQPFAQPEEHLGADGKTTKKHGLEVLLRAGRNVVTTHAMFDHLADLARDGHLDGYEIVIDEVVDVAKSPQFAKPRTWEDIYVGSGYVDVDEITGIVSPTPKWTTSLDETDDALNRKLHDAAKSGRLLHLGDGNLLSVMPEALMKAGRSLTVYTYKAEGSMMFAYLNRLGLNPWHDKLDPEAERVFKADARKRITVRKIKALDGIRFSYSGQTGKKATSANAKRVSNALRSLAQNALRNVPRDHILVTCPKDLWYHKGIAPDHGDDGEGFRPGPYAKGSRLASSGKGKTRAIWIPNTTRGTNDHAHCTHAIYLYDQYLNPIVHRWIGGEEVISSDDYALTELVQWVWRTSVRRGGGITLYIPSKRMRELFLDWLWDGNVPTSVRDDIERRHQA